MRPNAIGIIGAILALFSVVLPWWTASFSSMGRQWNMVVYVHQANLSYDGESVPLDGAFWTGSDLWYGWSAFALTIAGGVFAIVDCVTKNEDKLLIAAATIVAVAVAIFVLGLHMRLSDLAPYPFFPRVGIFSGGESGETGYTSTLCLGFWLASVAVILMAVAPWIPSLWALRSTRAEAETTKDSPC